MLNGCGELILSGTNSYSGGTMVNAGTLIVINNYSLPGGDSLTVGAGGTLIFDRSLGASSVTVSAGAVAVPEPSTLILLAAGAIGLLGYARRRELSGMAACPAADDQTSTYSSIYRLSSSVGVAVTFDETCPRPGESKVG